MSPSSYTTLFTTCTGPHYPCLFPLAAHRTTADHHVPIALARSTELRPDGHVDPRSPLYTSLLTAGQRPTSRPFPPQQPPITDNPTHFPTMAQANIAQPNFVAVGNAFTTLAQEFPLFNNIPVANVQQQLAQLIAGMAAINQQLGDMEQRLNLRMDQQFNDLSQQIGALTTRVQTVETRLDLLPMRLANSAASHDPGRILTGPTGLLPGPTNTKALLQVATGPQLDALQAIVNAPDYAGTVAARRNVLKRFLGVE